MFEPQAISIGGFFFVPATWLALAILVYVAVRMSERLSPVRGEVARTVSDWLPTALLIYLLVYKFGPALLNPLAAVKNPTTLLFTTGSSASAVAALVVVCVWLGWKLWRSPHPWALLDVIAVAGLGVATGYNILFIDLGETTAVWWGWRGELYRYHPLHLYRVALLLPLLVWIVRQWRRFDRGTAFYWAALGGGIATVLVSFAAFSVAPPTLGLTNTQWLGIALAVLGWGVKVVRERTAT